MVSLTNRAILTATMVLTLVSPGAWATAPDQEASCRSFVQSFYNWYIASGKKGGADSTVETALKKRPADFSPELRRGLKADIDASAKSTDGVVGLDFDPFLASQIDPEPYEAKKVTMNGASYLVDVYATLNGKKGTHPHVRPELTNVGGHWQFTNFHYLAESKNDKEDDLITVLRSLAADRKKYSKNG
jgi:hypothetical protein